MRAALLKSTVLLFTLLVSVSAVARPLTVGWGNALDHWMASTWTEPLETGAVIRFWRPPTLLVSPTKSAPSAEVLLATADQFLGFPMSGVGFHPTDSIAAASQMQFTPSMDMTSRVSRDQFKVGVEVSRSGLMPGDLPFFSQQPGRERFRMSRFTLGTRHLFMLLEERHGSRMTG